MVILSTYPDSYDLNDDEKKEIEKSIQKKLTGSDRAGTFMINFANGEKSIEVTALEVNDAHKQWSFLSQESRDKIITAHEVVSPMLFGIKDASGFSSNADELAESERQTIERVVQPKQDAIIDAFEEILATDGITLDLYFKPLSERKELDSAKTELSTHICCSSDSEGVADALIKLGTTVDSEEWELVSSDVIDEPTITESQLNSVLELARVPDSKSGFKSKQDTSLFKIRYAYKGESTDGKNHREFCKKVVAANLVYREEDIKQAGSQGANKGFGVDGADNYDIFLYKGGPNCKHFFERKIFLKKGNEAMTVNAARKLILTLEPSKRKNAMWKQNDKKVAKMPYDMPNHGYKN